LACAKSPLDWKFYSPYIGRYEKAFSFEKI
jgi:hypothetical protein